MLCEEIKNGRDSLYVVTANRYGSRTLTRDGNRSVFVTLDDATVCYYEGGTTAHIRRHSTFAYENLYGNLVRRTESSTSQNVTQGLLYAPFGEITTEYAPLWQNGTLPKYAFNAKELDEETGMYYYEARYYKPPVFTSRDPMFEKCFWMTPYAYCANNPVKYVVPMGCEFGDYFDLDGNYLGWDGEYDGKVYFIKDKASISKIKANNENGTTNVSDVNVITGRIDFEDGMQGLGVPIYGAVFYDKNWNKMFSIGIEKLMQVFVNGILAPN